MDLENLHGRNGGFTLSDLSVDHWSIRKNPPIRWHHVDGMFKDYFGRRNTHLNIVPDRHLVRVARAIIDQWRAHQSCFL